LPFLANVALSLILFELGYRIHLRWFRHNPWVLALGLVLAGRQARALNLMLRGDVQATTQGVDVERERRALVLIAALATGTAVTLAGAVGFVGFVAPHLLRLTIGNDQRYLLPAAALAGGVLVLATAFEALDIRKLHVSEAAMREGVLHDMVGRGGKADPREESVAALMTRYAIDTVQADRVEATALALFDEVETDWGLEAPDRQMLAWAARLHEIGLAIAHSQYHVHGAYILENSDIAGFSRTEQQFLATLVRNQRRALRLTSFEGLPDRLAPAAQRCAMLLRLAVLLHRAHEAGKIPGLRLRVGSGELQLKLSKSSIDSCVFH
jgi:hypothetical protein